MVFVSQNCIQSEKILTIAGSHRLFYFPKFHYSSMLSIISQATDQLTAQGLERHIDRSNQVLEEYLGALNRPSKIEDVHPF